MTARRQRALLALLVLNPNQVLGSAQIIEELWGDSLPEAPLAALQVVVSRLRTRLGAFGRSLVAEPGGYRLDVGPDETDLLVAETLLRDGRVELERNEAARAVTTFERALALWNGNALDDLAELHFAAEAARRLRELQLSLVEARNDALLADGRHLEVLADIDELVDAEPLREHIRAQQVTALYRAGRQAEALRNCDTHRRALREEVGIGPSAAMAALERRVLDQDPGLLAVGAGFMTPLPAWTAEILPFVGRRAECAAVLSGFSEAIDEGMRFVFVEGEPGIGKSRFLLQIARLVARDAIVLPVHVRDVFSPALHALARVMAEATLRISDEELRIIVADLPDVPNDIAQVRAVAAALVSGRPVQQILRDEDLLVGGARWIGALSAKAPIVLLVDDLDAAGRPVLEVIRQLAALASPKRVLVVCSARTSLDLSSSSLARTLEYLSEYGLLQRTVLPPLAVQDVDELLERAPIPHPFDAAARLHELTGGNPFLIAETIGAGMELSVDENESPASIRDAAQRRMAELGRATAELLEQASMFDRDFTVDALARVVGATTGTVANLLDRAVAARVLQPSTLTSYCFVHQVFRRAVMAELSVEQRTEGRRRIEQVLGSNAEQVDEFVEK